MWYWEVSIFEVSHNKHNWKHSLGKDSGLCAADGTVHKYTIRIECRHVESSVHIVTTLLYTVYSPYPVLTVSSQSTTAFFPQLQHISLAVWPISSFILTFAPLSTSSFPTNKCPVPAAQCSEVFLLLFTAFTFAPQSNNRRHTSKYPYQAASWRAVCWFALVLSTLAPPSSNTRTTTTWPNLATYTSSVCDGAHHLLCSCLYSSWPISSCCSRRGI